MGRRHRSADAAPVEIYFSNPDKVFANEHPSPRFGQGALAVALQALLTQVIPLQRMPHRPPNSPQIFQAFQIMTCLNLSAPSC